MWLGESLYTVTFLKPTSIHFYYKSSLLFAKISYAIIQRSLTLGYLLSLSGMEEHLVNSMPRASSQSTTSRHC